jgi:hypothetical protein
LKIWGEAEERRDEWEEVVLAGYSSLRHFCDMLADGEYEGPALSKENISFKAYKAYKESITKTA